MEITLKSSSRNQQVLSNAGKLSCLKETTAFKGVQTYTWQASINYESDVPNYCTISPITNQMCQTTALYHQLQIRCAKLLHYITKYNI